MINLILGSSSCELFSLIKNNNILINKFKGANILGLIKPDNNNREKINLIVKKYGSKLKKIIFIFGEVDIHFSYFYNLVYRDIDLLTDKSLNFDIISKKYIEFVDSLKYYSNCPKVIIGPFPNTLLNEVEIYNRLILYGILDKEEFPSFNCLDQSIVLNFNQKKQVKVFETFNKYLSKYCQQYNYKFIDLSLICLNKKGIIKKNLIHKHNKLNIHLNWEPLIKPLSLACGLKNLKLKNSLKQTQKKFYLERTNRNINRNSRKNKK